jgi:hypothetical protein
MDLPLTEAQLADGMAKRQRGEVIQRCFPQLSADHREFLMTGTPPEVWDKMFAD